MNDDQSKKELSRRSLLARGSAALAGGALLVSGENAHATTMPAMPAGPAPTDPTDGWTGTASGYHPVVVPNGWKLPWKMVGGAKVFHMVAEPVDHELAPGIKAHCWGYNGRVHGPVIEAVEGDLVRIYVTNRLPEGTSVHWHGLFLPNGMDGVAGLNQKAIEPGETYKYEFRLRQHGTFMYHAHHDEMTQMALGMTGMFIIHPRKLVGARIDRDFVLLLHEWRIDPGTMRPNPIEMTEFNMLTVNAKAYPGTEPLVVKLGERVKLRIGNLSAMDHHPIHIHGHAFKITETDGGHIPESAQWPETTVLVATGQTRCVEFVADAPGDWALHCHMTHHVMNQMGHSAPNLIGVKAGGFDDKLRGLLPGYMTMGQDGMGDMSEPSMPVPTNSIPMLGGKGKHDVITMGGMFTVVKVREHLGSYADPGWYENPPGTLVGAASPGDIARDGIDPDLPPPAWAGSSSRSA